VIELHTETVGRVQRARAGNQSLGKLGVNAPIASFVRIGKRRARNPLTDPHVVQLAGLRGQAHLDVAQTSQ
jgi:hypothetical protein